MTEAMLQPALEGASLADCLAHGRLFTVDLGLLHGLKDVNGHEVSWCHWAWGGAPTPGRLTLEGRRRPGRVTHTVRDMPLR